MAVIKIRWNVDELENVLSQFDQQKVWRSTVGEPFSWAEITGPGTRVALVAGQADYYYDDTAGDPDYYYAISYFDSTGPTDGSLSPPIRGDYSGVQYLTLADLENLVGSAAIREYFDDEVDGSLADDTDPLYQVLAAAEGEAATRLMRSWNVDQITLLAQNDRTFRNHVAWVAVELASERRTAFTAPDGSGAHKYQYERAIAYFEALSKGKTRSPGEAQAGVGANIGGVIQPAREAPGAPRFMFAPDRDNPRGQGGF